MLWGIFDEVGRSRPSELLECRQFRSLNCRPSYKTATQSHAESSTLIFQTLATTSDFVETSRQLLLMALMISKVFFWKCLSPDNYGNPPWASRGRANLKVFTIYR